MQAVLARLDRSMGLRIVRICLATVVVALLAPVLACNRSSTTSNEPVVETACRSLSPEQQAALATIRTAEQRYKSAHVTMHLQIEESDSGTVKADPIQFVDVDGTLGFQGPLRFNCMTTGRIVFHTFREQWSLDDRELRVLRFDAQSGRPSTGNVLPASRLDNKQLEFTLFRGGVSLFLPAYAGCGLSTYIEGIPASQPNWKVIESTDTSLVIWVPTHETDETFLQNLNGYVIGLDLTKGGNITRWEEWFDYWGLNCRRQKILQASEFEEIDGLWFPAKLTVDVVNDDRSEKLTLRRTETAELTWTEVNAEVDDQEFRIEFPPDIHVEHYLKPWTY